MVREGRETPGRLRGTQKTGGSVLPPAVNAGEHSAQQVRLPGLFCTKWAGSQGPSRDPGCGDLRARCRSQVPSVALCSVPGWTILSGNRKSRLGDEKLIRGQEEAALPYAPM